MARWPNRLIYDKPFQKRLNLDDLAIKKKAKCQPLLKLYVILLSKMVGGRGRDKVTDAISLILQNINKFHKLQY